MARYCISDDPAGLSDLARRWGVKKRTLQYIVDRDRIGPAFVASNVGIYGAVEQEQLARALEAKRRYRRRSANPVQVRAAVG